MLIDKKVPWTDDATTLSVRTGYVELFALAVERKLVGYSEDGMALVDLVGPIGNLAAIKIATRDGTAWNPKYGIFAVKKGHVHVLEWAYGMNLLSLDGLVDLAAKSGQLRVLQWAHGHRIPLNPSIHVEAAKREDRDMSKWALDSGCKLTNYIAAVVARKLDSLRALRYLQSLGCPMSGNVAVIAVAYNPKQREDTVHWIVDCKLPLTTELSAAVASSGDQTAMAFLRDHGCPWDESTVANARAHYRHRFVEWAISKGCPCPIYEPPPGEDEDEDEGEDEDD
jgi:hypothetical protein